MCSERSPFAPSVCATVSGTSAGSRSGGEPDPEDPGLELADELGRRLDRQSRLARAAGTGQGHEPSAVAQQSGDFIELPLTADERTHRPRQVGVRDRLQRREALVSELEDRHRVAEILQPMLAQVCDVDPVEQLLGHMREQHLAAVAALMIRAAM